MVYMAAAGINTIVCAAYIPAVRAVRVLER